MKVLRAYPAGKIFGFEQILNRPSPKRDAPGAECGEILTNEIRDVRQSTSRRRCESPSDTSDEAGPRSSRFQRAENLQHRIRAEKPLSLISATIELAHDAFWCPTSRSDSPTTIELVRDRSEANDTTARIA